MTEKMDNDEAMAQSQPPPEWVSLKYVRRLMTRFVIPAFIVLAVGVGGAIGGAWFAYEHQAHAACIQRADARDDLLNTLHTIVHVVVKDKPTETLLDGVIDKALPEYNRSKCPGF